LVVARRVDPGFAVESSRVNHQHVSLPSSNRIPLSGRGRAPAADDSDNLFIASSNGDTDGITNFANSVIRLSPDGTGVADWFSPFERAPATHPIADAPGGRRCLEKYSVHW
jgi:hypothetical protein